jgi:hypothetical protein
MQLKANFGELLEERRTGFVNFKSDNHFSNLRLKECRGAAGDHEKPTAPRLAAPAASRPRSVALGHPARTPIPIQGVGIALGGRAADAVRSRNVARDRLDPACVNQQRFLGSPW